MPATETELEIMLKEELGQIKTFLTERLEKGVKVNQEEMKRIADSLTQTQTEVKKLRLANAARVEDGRIRVPSGRFAGFDFLDLKIATELIKRRVQADITPRSFLEEAEQARRDMRSYLDVEAVLRWEDGSKQRMSRAFPEGSTYKSQQMFAERLIGWRGAMIPMALRAMDSTTAGAGDELVPTFEAAELWMDVNLDTLVLPLMMQTTMPTNPFDIPLQLGDTNWYPSEENITGTTTNLSTAKVTLTAKGLKTGVPFSDELEEDAIINTVAEIRAGLVRNAAEVIDDVLLNADQTAANGINSDGATISTATAGKAHWLLGFDGLIHLPLVDNTSQRVDLNGAVSANTVYNQALRKLGKYASGRRPGEVVFIGDVNTVIATLALDEVETVDKLGGRATISTGEVSQIYGVPLVRSEQMLLADTDGKVTDSGNGTATGRVLCFNTSQWRVGFRRGITIEPDREPGKNQTTMYVTFRIALSERTGTRSSATHTSLVYDITSVT